LGSGKTTLLNYILQEQKEQKIAIIENEFGEIAIDDALLKENMKSDASKVVVMDNGCMCCAGAEELVVAVQQILDVVKGGAKIDSIMIETTGMADPVPIVRTISGPPLSLDLRLDAVIAMADAKNLIGRLDDKVEEGKVNEAFQQVAFADRLILNKLDLVSTEEAIVVKDRIREINKFAKVLPAIRGRVKMEELMDIKAHDMHRFADLDIDKEADIAEELRGHQGGQGSGHGHTHGHSHGHEDECHEEHGTGGAHGDHGGHGSSHGSGHGDTHDAPEPGQGHSRGHGHGSGSESRHDSRVNSFSIVREGEADPDKFRRWWMLHVMSMHPAFGTLFRIKGIMAIRGNPRKRVFHAVMGVGEEEDAAPWAEGERKVSKMVFIGKSIDQDFLRQGFESIFED